jgi:methionine-rich copper-binding protein CopC
MKRLIVIMIAALIWALPTTAMAHSKLQSATPAVDAKIDASPQSIEMVFNTKIEKISTFMLFNEAGEQIETGDAKVDGDTMSGILPSPLDNGSYTVKWTIIGADSHAVEGEYSFSVEAPAAPSPSPTPEPETSVTPTVSPSAEASATHLPTDASDGQDAEEEDPLKELTSSPISAVVGIAAVGAVLVLMLRRRKP